MSHLCFPARGLFLTSQERPLHDIKATRTAEHLMPPVGNSQPAELQKSAAALPSAPQWSVLKLIPRGSSEGSVAQGSSYKHALLLTSLLLLSHNFSHLTNASCSNPLDELPSFDLVPRSLCRKIQTKMHGRVVWKSKSRSMRHST